MSTHGDGAPADALKLVYLAPRRRGLTGEAFRSRWHDHAQLTMRLPGLTSLARHELHRVLTPDEDPGLPAALFQPGALSSDYGGVGIVWLHGDLDALASQRATDDAGAARSDALDTFGSDLGANVHVTLDEVVFDHGGTTLSIFSFLARKPALTLQEFSGQWRGFADAFLAHPELTRHCSSYVQAHRVPEGGDARFDGIAVMGFRDLTGVFGLLSEPTLAGELFTEEEPFIDRAGGVVVLTRPDGALERDAAR